MNIEHRKLTAVAERIFAAIGCEAAEAEIISKLLVTANLTSDDLQYLQSLGYKHVRETE